MERNPVFTTICEEISEVSFVRRHVLCPNYDACLDEAIRRDQSFECTQCAFKRQNISFFFVSDDEAA